MENYEHQQAKQTRTYRNFFEKIHKHFKNLEQKKKKPKLSFSFHANFPGLAYILTDTPISHHQRLVLVRFGPQGYAIQL